MLFAMGPKPVATPVLSVNEVVVAVKVLKNMQLAPVAGAVKVTAAFGTTFPEASLTVTCNEAPNLVFVADDCPLPDLGVIEAGAPAVLVRLKVAVIKTPGTEATTL